ncbi:glycosyltransferase [Sediminitomix flava]|uniref:Cellulose synthase/poly-beta-1,6-N-acetylglucosamine synthase-like glycosyltransferase n=1 Tax=Sediminitomix flava TaxID=379075 RepID=A0A315Z4U2_SEDFL|nr:glycosyltransferase family 2 protein [Sediminitomix flava]PWJ38508.1 cellulose synthase/poly-beta-1,6-N-acetylglucosamine synthase-like glycosyltransferase [Sediminitomix flava]
MLEGIYYVISIIILFYSFYTFLTLFLGSLYKSERVPKNFKYDYSNWIVFIPAYKPSHQLIQVIEKVKKYSEDITVYVLLQESSEEIRNEVLELDCIVEEKTFKGVVGNPYHEVLRYMCNQLEFWNRSKKLDQKDFIVLLDKDNLVTEDFFKELAFKLEQGYDLVQGRRVAISDASSGEVYDSFSENLNDLMFRASKSLLKGTPELSGSGFVCKRELFQIACQNLDRKAPGMDKNLLIQMMMQKPYPKIVYQPSAILKEEKTAEVEDLKQQRIRWFGNQYFNAIKYVEKLIRRKRWETFDYAVTLWRPPRSVLFALVPFFAGIEILGLVLFPTSFYLLNIASLIFLTLGVIVFATQYPSFLLKFKTLMMKFHKIVLNNLWSVKEGIDKKNQGKFINTKHKV